MRCQGRRASIAIAITSATMAIAADREAGLRRDRVRDRDLVRGRIERKRGAGREGHQADEPIRNSPGENDEARRDYGQHEQSERSRVLADRGCHHERACDQADRECSEYAASGNRGAC